MFNQNTTNNNTKERLVFTSPAIHELAQAYVLASTAYEAAQQEASKREQELLDIIQEKDALIEHLSQQIREKPEVINPFVNTKKSKKPITDQMIDPGEDAGKFASSSSRSLG